MINFALDLLQRVRCDSQMNGGEEPLLTELCISAGLLSRDIHGCLFLTETGEAALKERLGDTP